MAAVTAIVATAGIVLPILQSQWHHSRSQRTNVLLFEEEIQLRETQHAERQRASHRRFREEQDHEILQDLVRYRVRLALNRRQVVRDAWFQRFLMNQTLLVIVGLLLGCCFTNLGQGAIPPIDTLYTSSVYLHGASLGIAIATLASSLWCSLKYLHRLNHFNHGDPEMCVYVCGKKHTTFNDYFDCHCEPLRWWSVLLLGVGLIAVLFSGAVYVSMTMLKRDTSGLVVLCAAMAVGVLCVIVLEKMVPDDTVVRNLPKKRRHPRSHEPAAVQSEAGVHREDFGGLRSAADAEKAIEQLLHDRALTMEVIREHQREQQLEAGEGHEEEELRETSLPPGGTRMRGGVGSS